MEFPSSFGEIGNQLFKSYSKGKMGELCSWKHVLPARPQPQPLVGSKPFHHPTFKICIQRRSQWKVAIINPISASSTCTCPSATFNRRLGKQPLGKQETGVNGSVREKGKYSKKRVFFLDVNPLCYEGSTPSLHSFAYWISLFFSQVTHNDPIIAVFDGERGSERRRQLLPSYKAHRRKFSRNISAFQRFSKATVGRTQQIVQDVLSGCDVPVIRVEGHEADDVVATLAHQVLLKGYRVVIASPDKDFKQLISEDVQIVIPMADLGRWSFYTLKHYISQYNCDPESDLSLRCILGDEVDGVPGIQHLAPAFGRKTAIKLLKKHGSLDNLLNAAAIRTVGKQYAQDALTKHADYLRKNYEVLALRRDVRVDLKEEWLAERNTCCDSAILSDFFKLLENSTNDRALKSKNP